MSKPTILVAKWGCAFWTREARMAQQGRQATRGDLGDTEGLLRHLTKRKDCRLIYYGRYRGDPLPNLEVIQPESSLRLDEWATVAEQRTAFQEDFERLPKADYRFALSNLGPGGSWFTVNNATAATIRGSDVQHRAPWADVIQQLKLPHAVTCNDIRNAAQLRYGEFNDTYPHVVPVAWLDQTQIGWTKTIQGKRWRSFPVRGHVETWTALPPALKCPKSRDVVLVAHAHIKTGNCQPGRDKAWRSLLGDKAPPALEVYGEGWEHYTGPRKHVKFKGFCPPRRTWELFAESTCSPFLAPVSGYATNKPAFMAQQNCIPIPYGRGEPFTADQLFPMNSPWRVNKPGDLAQVVKELCNSYTMQQTLLLKAKNAMRPNWRLLDQLVDAMLEGTDTTTDAWLKKFGGMRRV